jgi:hypothetical protein
MGSNGDGKRKRGRSFKQVRGIGKCGGVGEVK